MDYELIDSGAGRRLEKYGAYLLDRPDPQIIWNKSLPETEWGAADAFFQKTSKDKGIWIKKNKIPEKWQMEHLDTKFLVKLTPFKHTGVFPEQASQWEYIYNTINNLKEGIKVLNLFAYTGIASIFAAKAGAEVTHVDASRPAITWANENRQINDPALPIRWIIDDALKFSQREIKRKNKYDIIIMDPPVYGHGPAGETWDFNKDFPKLLVNCRELLSDKPIFILVNAYAISASSIALANSLSDFVGDIGGKIENGELLLREEGNKRSLSTGIWARWSNIL